MHVVAPHRLTLSRSILFVAVYLATCLTQTALGGTLGRPVDFALSQDGARLYVALHDRDVLIVVSTADGAVELTADTGPGPTGVTVLPGSGEVWVVCRWDDRIHRFDGNTLVALSSIDVPLYCERVQSDTNGAKVYVTNSAHNALYIIDTATLLVETVDLPGRAPKDLLVDSDDDRVYIAQSLSESVAVVDTVTKTVLADVQVGAVPADRALLGENVIVGHLGLIGGTDDDDITNTATLIDRSTFAVTADFLVAYATPKDALYDHESGRAWVACFGSDVVVEMNPFDGAILSVVDVGPNPGRIIRHADGRMFVLNELGDSISVIDNGIVVDTWGLNADFPGLTTAELRGERVFNTDSDYGPYTCFSCHPNGELDGLSRFLAPPDYLDGLTINTPSLRFARWTPPFRRNGSTSGLAIQEANVLTVMRGETPSGEDLSDLVAYVNSLGPSPNPFAKQTDELDSLELQGQALFEQLKCGSCHLPMLYTDGMLHDVGTGGEADTPSLLGLWQSAPYLHDGRADALEDVFAPVEGRHQPWIESADDRAALAAYLLTLPNPAVFWSLPPSRLVDSEAVVSTQVFDQATGRPVADAVIEIEEISGLSGLEIVQPSPTDGLGETSGTVHGSAAGIAQLQLRLNGEVATEVRVLEFYPPGNSFVNVASLAGVDYVAPSYAYPRAVAVADYDNDGYADIFVAVSGKDENGEFHIGSPSVLYRNRGDGTFEDATVAAGLYREGKSSAGAAWGDYDNDGDLDLYVNNRGGLNDVAVSELFRNNLNEGYATFTEVANDAGVANPGFGYTVVWFDCDHDGWLDLYVENLTGLDDINEGNNTPDALYHNNGDGTFLDITDYSAAWILGGGDGGAVADYDDDGWQDILKIAADSPYKGYYLLHNEGNCAFTEYSDEAGFDLGTNGNSRGLVFGDYDNDGDHDVFVVGKGLFRNNGDTPRTFTNVTAQMGFSFTPYSNRRFGHTFTDLDNDGGLDIVAENRTNAKPAIFMNQQGSGEFLVLEDIDPLEEYPGTDPKVGLGVLDYDNDGDMDVFLCREGEAAYEDAPQVLYENRLGNDHHFLRISLEGTSPITPRSANGARITIESPTLWQMREIRAGENASGCADYVQHVGLANDIQTDRITVDWPSGIQDVFFDVPANQHILIREGDPTIDTLRTWFDVDIAAVPISGTEPLSVQFSSTVLHATGSIAYLWDFGDGNFDTASSPQHLYFSDCGVAVELTATLTVTDQATGQSDIESVLINITPRQKGDADGDLDIDLADFAAFQTCRSSSGSIACDCAWSDFDGDTDVDFVDFAGFQTAFTGMN